MALLIFARKFDKNLIRKVKDSSFRYCSSATTSTIPSENVPETVPKVQYPPILDMSKEAVQDREKIAWHDEVKKVQTIEEKLLKINVPYYYGLRTIPLNDQYVYNCLPYMQHWTRTQVEKELPGDWYPHTAEEVDALVNNIREEFIEAILFQYQDYRYTFRNENRPFLKMIKKNTKFILIFRYSINTDVKPIWMSNYRKKKNVAEEPKR